MSLTGGLAAAVDGLRDVVDAVRPILCFLQSVLVRILEDIPCRADQLRHTACEADQSAVHAGEPGDAQGLVVAGDQADIGALLTEQADVMLVDGGDAGAHLDALDVVDLLAHLDQGLDRVEGLGGCGIQVDDDVDVSTLSNVLDILEGSVGVHAEAQPHVRGHQQDAVCTSFLGFLGHGDGLCGVLAVDARDDGHHVAALLRADLDDALALGTGQAGDLTGVAVADQTFDSLAVEALDPAQISAELRLVDGVIVVQRDGHSGEDGLERFNLSHNENLLLSKINVVLVFVLDRRSCFGDHLARRCLWVFLCNRLLSVTLLYHGCKLLVNKNQPPCKVLHTACNALHNLIFSAFSGSDFVHFAK